MDVTFVSEEERNLCYRVRAADMLDKLAQLSCKKRLIVSAVQGIGSKDSLKALSHLLKREAGFEIVHAPVGGHMGPVTHSKEILPLMLPS